MTAQVRTIYLDNSHLHLLSELRRTNPTRFESFLKVWTAHDCVLALSQAHLSEINRYEDQPRREARYEFLATLLPIYSDLPIGDDAPHIFLSLTNREIFNALIKRGVISLKEPVQARFGRAFPNTLTSKTHIDLLRGLSTIPVYQDVLNAFYQATEVAASANSRPPNTKYEMRRLSEIPNTGLAADMLSEAMRGLDEMEIDGDGLDAFTNLISKEQLEQVLGDLKAAMENFGQRTGEIGAANALAEYLGTNSTDRRSLDELIAQHTFEFIVRQFVVELCPDQNDDTITNLSAQVKLEDCPGTWLKNAVRLEMRKAMPVDRASNHYDLEHLSYLPYVDRFFADKRIAHCAAQVLNSIQVPNSVTGLHAPIAIPNYVDALESEICSTH